MTVQLVSDQLIYVGNLAILSDLSNFNYKQETENCPVIHISLSKLNWTYD